MANSTPSVQQSSYRSIFKATSLFGGVQVYQILISIAKSKIIAVLLGPNGVGILGLYTSGIQFIQSLTSMGLSSSAVRDVSESSATNNQYRIGRTVAALRKLVWLTGILGLIAVAVFSPLLSVFAFGNKDYTIPFVLLSITLLIDQLSSGQKVILQGTRRLKDLAKASALGSTFGLIVSIPFYYLMGIKGIVPTLILNSVSMLLLTWYYSRKVNIKKIELSNKDTFKVGTSMLKLGIAMSVTNILTLGCSFMLRGYIRNIGGTEDVGFYAAGFAILGSYVGMVFNAMSTDYYPRLAAVNSDNKACCDLVNKQGEIASLILCPLIVSCLVFTPILIRLLYSDSFDKANDYVMIAAVGMFFRMGSWLIAYQFIAKGESKLFVINELTANLYMFIFNILGYKFWSMSGLGLSFTIGYLCYFIQVYLIARLRYSFSITSAFLKLFILQFLWIVVCFCSTFIQLQWVRYSVGCLIILISLAYSMIGLDTRIALFSFISARIHKNDK